MDLRWPRRWKSKRRAITPSGSDRDLKTEVPGRRTLNLPVSMRGELKKPLGKLLKGHPSKTVHKLKKILKEKNPPYFAVVGDITSKNILRADLQPDLVVVDNRVMRVDIEPIDLQGRESIPSMNQAGTIDTGAWVALREAITLKSKASVIVEGEEDLLVLPLILMLPEGSLIVYGQPREGMVVVEVTTEMREWTGDFISRMEEC